MAEDAVSPEAEDDLGRGGERHLQCMILTGIFNDLVVTEDGSPADDYGVDGYLVVCIAVNRVYYI